MEPTVPEFWQWQRICGVGVAYHSKVAGIQLLSGQTDAKEAIALGFHNQHIHIPTMMEYQWKGQTAGTGC